MTLDAARIAGLLRTARYGRSLDVRPRTSSTNDDARIAAERGAPDGHVVVADAQDGGRGARGSAWESPPGTDLYLSIVVRPRLSLAELPLVTLATGLGVHACVASMLADADVARPVSVRVKWPNDVLVDGRKCAGILVETSSLGDAIDTVVVGIGLNVNRRAFPAAFGDTATSLALFTGAEHDRERVLASLLSEVEQRVDALVARGPAAIVDALADRLAWRGEQIVCGDVAGELQGIDATGALLVAEADGRVVRILSGSPRRIGVGAAATHE